jgi:hypothetical protein
VRDVAETNAAARCRDADWKPDLPIWHAFRNRTFFGRRSTREITRRRARTHRHGHARSVLLSFDVSLALGSASRVSSAASPGARRTPANSSEKRIDLTGRFNRIRAEPS